MCEEKLREMIKKMFELKMIPGKKGNYKDLFAFNYRLITFKASIENILSFFKGK